MDGGAREADVVIGDKTLHVAAVHGTGNLRKFIERMRAEKISIMTLSK